MGRPFNGSDTHAQPNLHSAALQSSPRSALPGGDTRREPGIMRREELHRRVELLSTRLNWGRFYIAPHLAAELQNSMLKIRHGADGMVEPDSVDGRIRSLLTFITHQDERDEWRDTVSLRQIQEAYFDIVRRAFDRPYRTMTEAASKPSRFAAWFVSDSKRVGGWSDVTDQFVADVVDFWRCIPDSGWAHLEASSDSKAVLTDRPFFGGGSDFAGSTGIYFDTTILPDPFVDLSFLMDRMDQKGRCHEVLRLALQVLRCRDLALADIATPVVVILADRFKLVQRYGDFIQLRAENDTLRHATGLFGREFGEVEELRDFLRIFKEPDALAAALGDPSELDLNAGRRGDLCEHIRRCLEEQSGRPGVHGAGDAMFMHWLHGFLQANEGLQRSQGVGGTPVTRSEGPWRWFRRLLRGNAVAAESEGRVALHTARELGTAAGKEIVRLGNVPREALIAIRRAGALEEVRDILGAGLKEIAAARPNAFFATGDRVFENLQSALRVHERNINALRAKKWTFSGHAIESLLDAGGMAAAAAVTGIRRYGDPAGEADAGAVAAAGILLK